jgi:hypothetical protein
VFAQAQLLVASLNEFNKLNKRKHCEDCRSSFVICMSLQKSINLNDAQKKTLLRHRRYFFSTLEMLMKERQKTEADLAVSPLGA